MASTYATVVTRGLLKRLRRFMPQPSAIRRVSYENAVHELVEDSFESIPIRESSRTTDVAQDCRQESDSYSVSGISREPKLWSCGADALPLQARSGFQAESVVVVQWAGVASKMFNTTNSER